MCVCVGRRWGGGNPLQPAEEGELRLWTQRRETIMDIYLDIEDNKSLKASLLPALDPQT